ncbi:MAG: diguanylate cyclase [Butyrivibrio sp.]|nr:diguanylate cyclase [Butyrivibrio sp.]
MTKAVKVRLQTGLLSLVALSIVIVFLRFLGNSKFNTPSQFDLVQLDSGWTISRGMESWDLERISLASTGIVNSGDVIVLSRTLPDTRLDPATIYFKTVLSTVDVFVDDYPIYRFGENYLRDGHMMPKMLNFVQLPKDYQGKELKIVLTAREDNAFSGLSPVYFGNYNDIFTYLLQLHRMPMVIGVYLIVFAFLLLVMSPFLFFASSHDYSILFGALTSWAMGSYILCYNDVFWMFTDSPGLFTSIEYFSLFAIPAATMGFVIAAHQSHYKKIANILFLINSLFLIVTTILHVTSLIHINHFVTALHILGITEGSFLIISILYATIKSYMQDNPQISASTNMLVIGLVLFLICALIDIFKYNVMKFSPMGEVNSHINFLTIGALLFTMSLLLNYFFHCIEYISESSEKEHLEGLAYNDPLTGLQNRSRCEQVLAELSGTYTIISLDLDYLKYTNDNFGHSYGDKLLSGFADILKNTFTDSLLIGRMGGDEFIVVLAYVDEERLNRTLNNLSDQLNYRNSLETKLRFSASFGYATSKDKEVRSNLSAQQVYLLADQRMYTMKNKHHKQTLGRLYDDLLNKILEKGGDEDQ